MKLWESVRRFVAKAAYKWVHNSNGRIPHEDLMQAGLEDVASKCGQSSKQAVKEAEERALDRLARGKYRRELKECLDGFEEFRADTWNTIGSSRTETAALRNIEKEGLKI